MKKITRFGVLAFVVAALFVSMSGFAQAESSSNSDSDDTAPDTSVTSLKMRGDGSVDDMFKRYGGIDAKVKAELEATLKAQKARCEALTNKDRKDLCIKQSEAGIRAKLNAMTSVKVMPKDVSGIRGESVKADAKPMIGAEKSVVVSEGTTQTNDRNVVERLRKNIERLYAYIERFGGAGGIAERLESRMKKLSAEGVDVSASTKLVTQARLQIKAATVAADAAKAAFESELNGTNTESNIKYSTVLFKKYCTDAGTAIQMTAPERCLVDGITYVNTDRQPEGTATNMSKFAKTTKYIAEAGKNLIWAQSNLIQAVNSLKPGLNGMGDKTKIRAEGSAGANTATEVN